MKSLLKEQQLARELRKKGLSYREIQQTVHVSKASLSLWVRDIVLTEEQRERLRKREPTIGPMHAGIKSRARRIQIEQKLHGRAKIAVGNITKRELFLIATALYWAEGSKIRNRTSVTTVFSNQDVGMLLVFYQWLRQIKIEESRICMTMYVHEVYRSKTEEFLSYWKSFFPSPKIHWKNTIYKKHIKQKRFMRYNCHASIANEGMHSEQYRGLLRISVGRSANLTRYLAGASRAIAVQCPVV